MCIENDITHFRPIKLRETAHSLGSSEGHGYLSAVCGLVEKGRWWLVGLRLFLEDLTVKVLDIFRDKSLYKGNYTSFYHIH